MSLWKLCNEQLLSAEASSGFSGHPAKRLCGHAFSVAKNTQPQIPHSGRETHGILPECFQGFQGYCIARKVEVPRRQIGCTSPKTEILQRGLPTRAAFLFTDSENHERIAQGKNKLHYASLLRRPSSARLCGRKLSSPSIRAEFLVAIEQERNKERGYTRSLRGMEVWSMLDKVPRQSARVPESSGRW